MGNPLVEGDISKFPAGEYDHKTLNHLFSFVLFSFRISTITSKTSNSAIRVRPEL